MTQNKKWKWSRTVKTKYCRTLMEKDTKLDWEEQEWLFLIKNKKESLLLSSFDRRHKPRDTRRSSALPRPRLENTKCISHSCL